MLVMLIVSIIMIDVQTSKYPEAVNGRPHQLPGGKVARPITWPVRGAGRGSKPGAAARSSAEAPGSFIRRSVLSAVSERVQRRAQLGSSRRPSRHLATDSRVPGLQLCQRLRATGIDAIALCYRVNW
jgi:hypothetical protein